MNKLHLISIHFFYLNNFIRTRSSFLLKN